MLIIVKFHCQETRKRELERNPFHIWTETFLIMWWWFKTAQNTKFQQYLSKEGSIVENHYKYLSSQWLGFVAAEYFLNHN